MMEWHKITVKHSSQLYKHWVNPRSKSINAWSSKLTRLSPRTKHKTDTVPVPMARPARGGSRFFILFELCICFAEFVYKVTTVKRTFSPVTNSCLKMKKKTFSPGKLHTKPKTTWTEVKHNMAVSVCLKTPASQSTIMIIINIIISIIIMFSWTTENIMCTLCQFYQSFPN